MSVCESIQVLFNSLLHRYQLESEKSVRGSELVFDSVNQLHYKYHGIGLNCGGSYIVYPE